MKLLRRDVISLVNIITTIYYYSTKVILIFSGLYTSPKLSLEDKFIMFVFVLSEMLPSLVNICSTPLSDKCVNRWGHLASYDKNLRLLFTS